MNIWGISDFIKDAKVATIDFESFKHPFRRRLTPQLSREAPSNKKRGHGPHLTRQTNRAQHTCCSNTNPTSKQRLIRSKQQLQQFASLPLFLPSILLNFILRRGDQIVHKHEGTRKNKTGGREKKKKAREWVVVMMVAAVSQRRGEKKKRM